MSSLIPSSSTINPCFPKTSQVRVANSHKNKTQISCKTAENNEITQDNNHPNSNSSTSRVVDRRNMLIGMGGLAAATSVGGIPASLALPAIPEVNNNCLSTDNWNPAGSANFQCCLNFKDKHIKEFDLSTITKGKTRPPAHKMTPEYLNNFKKAIDAMRARADNDPRSLNMQAFVHCAYCDGVYYQVPKESQIRYFVHNYWLFAAFHRWELFFFERIAGDLIGDPNFALPYWAFDNREGMTVPDVYEDRCSPLYDPTRSSRVKNKAVVDLSYIPGKTRDPPLSDEDLKIDNLRLMYCKMVNVRPSNFYGAQYKAGDVVAAKEKPDDAKQAGYIENGAHNAIHVWVGGNMGKYATAGRDPLFYGLHANVDRMWDVWRNKWGMNDDYTNKDDYKNASFVFYDKDGEPVKVYAKDCFDIDKLGYAYQDLDLEWENYQPSDPEECDKRNNVTRGDGGQQGGPQSSGGRGRGGPHRGGGRGHGGPHRGGGRGRGGPHRGGGRGRGGPFGGPRPVAWNTIVAPMAPFQLDSVVQTEVQRPRKSRSEEEMKAEEEVIVIDMNVSHTNDEMIKYDVYINDEHEHDPEERTLITPEYAGSFTMLPMNHGGGDHQHKAVLKLQLNRLLQDIGADDDDTLAVTLVPRIGQDAVVITGVNIDYINE